jgi:hypothetical protein
MSEDENELCFDESSPSLSEEKETQHFGNDSGDESGNDTHKIQLLIMGGKR